MRGKNIITYYNTRYNMQTYNTDNSKNKIYNYYTFNKNVCDYTQNELVEGMKVDNNVTVDAYQRLKNASEYIEKSYPNNDTVTSLTSQHDAQTKKVAELRPEYEAQKLEYDKCTNLKARCETINTRMNETQKKIDKIIKEQQFKENQYNSFSTKKTMKEKVNYLNENNIKLCDTDTKVDYTNKTMILESKREQYNLDEEQIKSELTPLEKQIYENKKKIDQKNNEINYQNNLKNRYNYLSNYFRSLYYRTYNKCWWYWRGWGFRRRCSRRYSYPGWARTRFINSSNSYRTLATNVQKVIDKYNAEKNELLKVDGELGGDRTDLNTKMTKILNNIKTNEKDIINNNNSCSTKLYSEVEKLMNDKNKEIKTHNSIIDNYADVCDSKLINCDDAYAKFKNIDVEYRENDKYKNDLNNQRITAKTPTTNVNKDLYAKTNKSTEKVKSTVTNVETYENWNSSDNADETHTKVVNNYKHVQGDYNKLKQNTIELNNNLNKTTSIYSSNIPKTDKAIYTNILLTTITTSLIYFILIDM